MGLQVLSEPASYLVPAILAPFVGSFLGALAVRLPEGRDIVTARSACPNCGHKLGPLDLVPIASWIALGGRCRHCRAPIDWYYPAMEVSALLVVLWAAVLLDGFLLWLTVGLGWALLALLAMDMRHLLLADAITLPLIAAGLLVAGWLDMDRLWLHGLGAVTGFLVMVAVAQLYRALRQRDGLGMGDAKLMAAAGAWIGIQGLGTVLLYAVGISLLYVSIARGVGRPVDASTPIPLGAGIALALWVVWLHGPLVWTT